MPNTAPTMRDRIEELRGLKDGIHAGDPRSTEIQRGKGKLLVRQRIELLFGPGSFREVEPLRRHRAQG